RQVSDRALIADEIRRLRCLDDPRGRSRAADSFRAPGRAVGFPARSEVAVFVETELVERSGEARVILDAGDASFADRDDAVVAADGEVPACLQGTIVGLVALDSRGPEGDGDLVADCDAPLELDAVSVCEALGEDPEDFLAAVGSAWLDRAPLDLGVEHLRDGRKVPGYEGPVAAHHELHVGLPHALTVLRSAYLARAREDAALGAAATWPARSRDGFILQSRADLSVDPGPVLESTDAQVL